MTARRWAVLGAVASTVLAAVWLVVVPEKADTTTGLQAFVVRWGHSACWSLLALACVLVVRGAPRAARVAAGSGGAAYAAFLAATLL